MAMEAMAAIAMKVVMTPDRLDPKRRSEIQPLLRAPSAIPIGRAMLIHLPPGLSL